MSLKANVAAAVAFLRLLYPEGPWTLVSIEPDRKGIEGATFRPATVEDLKRWVERNNKTRNVYYQLNRPLTDLAKKADRTDIQGVYYLHVDVDPRVGEDLASEQVRIKALLESPPGGVPRPSAVVYSGGGYNALWRLEEHIPIDGNLDAAEDAKRYNLQLEVLLGGDNCHNIDRILRLPGTVNYPDERKRRKGRTAYLAELEWFDEGTVFPLSLFTPAPKVQVSGGGSRGAGASQRPRVQVSGNIRRLQSLDELDQLAKTGEVKGKVKEVIVHGVDLDQPNRWPSRSEPLYWVACELVRSGVPDDIIYSVLTDPDFAISASVLEMRGTAEAYALRQIEQAKEHAISPMLRELNARHAVIRNLGGKCRVIEEVEDKPGARSRLTKQSFEDFRNGYMHRKVDTGLVDKAGNAIKVQLGKWWLEHEQRKQYDQIVFAPGRDVEGAYNLWRGFSCNAVPGTGHLPFLKHILDNICRGNDEHYQYIVKWMALAVQHPDRPGEVAIVLRGRQGTGKSAFAKTFGSLWGRHFLQIADSKFLVGSFNAHLRDCVVLFGDEAFFAGDPKHRGILKTLITEEMIIVEGKGIDAEPSANYTHLILASNENWVVPADADERRFLVMDVGDDAMQNSAYFGAIKKAMDSGGREALLHHLLTLDLTGFDHRAVPKTQALREQKLLSLSPEEEWWFRKLEDGQLLRQHLEWTAPIVKDELIADYLSYTQRLGTSRRANATALGRFLKRATPRGFDSEQKMRSYKTEDGMTARGRAWFWTFPSLDACRSHWDARFAGGVTGDWAQVVDRNAPVYEPERRSGSF